MSIYLQKYKSPIGMLYLVTRGSYLHAIYFERQWPKMKARLGEVIEKRTEVLSKTKKQLSEYFKGNRKVFDIPFELEGTQFQNSTWRALLKVPFGKTMNYKQQASLIRSPKAVRAVGRTNGLNPLCIILPCHRVIGSNGKLTGYAGGLSIKKYLLDLEATVVQREQLS